MLSVRCAHSIYVYTHIYTCAYIHMAYILFFRVLCSQSGARIFYVYPLKEEITLKRFGSRDLSVLPIDFLSDGDIVYSTEKSFAILGTPVIACLICMGTPVKT